MTSHAFINPQHRLRYTHKLLTKPVFRAGMQVCDPQSVLSKLKGTKTQADKPGSANYDRWYLFLEAHKVWWKYLRDKGGFPEVLVRQNKFAIYLCDCKLLFAGVGPAYWMGLWTFITIDPDLTAICSAQSRSLMFQLHPSLPAKATKLANGFSLYVFNYKVLCIYANQHFQARLLNTNCRDCWVPNWCGKYYTFSQNVNDDEKYSKHHWNPRKIKETKKTITPHL